MTTDDRSPMTRDVKASIDLWASRLLDGDIASSEIPDDLRAAVDVRVEAFAAMRSRLTDSASVADVRRRDEHIAFALASPNASATRLDQNRSAHVRFSQARIAVGLAASFLVVIGIAAALAGGSGSDDDVMMAESMSTEAAKVPLADSTEAFAQDGSDDSSEASAAGEQIEEQSAPADANTLTASALPQFSTIEEISAFAAELDPNFPISEGLNKQSPDSCTASETTARLVEEVLLGARRVQIHVFDVGDFQIFDSESCAIVVDRSGTSARATPVP